MTRVDKLCAEVYLDVYFCRPIVKKTEVIGMGCDGGPSASSLIAQNEAFKEADRNHPNGVQYADHLVDCLRDVERRLIVKVRGPRSVLWPASVFWKHPVNPVRSNLWIDFPDGLYRAYHEHSVQEAARFLGINPAYVETPAFVRDPRYHDGQRRPHGDDVEVIPPNADSWYRLVTAIKLTAEDSVGHLGGQLIKIFPYDHSVRVLVDEANGNLVVTLCSETIKAIRRELVDSFLKFVSQADE